MNTYKQSFSVNTLKPTASPKSAFDELHSLSNDIVQGRLPWYFYQIWNGSSLTALNKKETADLETNETMDCRPICKGEAIKKVITKALYKPYMNKIKAGFEPSPFAVGTNGGGSQLIMAITLLLEANPDWVIIALDISNAIFYLRRVMEKHRASTSMVLQLP